MDTIQRYKTRLRPAYELYKQHWSPILLCLELLLNIFFLIHGPLHPIDYPTYLRQINLITEKGIYDCKSFDWWMPVSTFAPDAEIHGPTGPLVYPAGHVLFFLPFERIFGVNATPAAHEFFGARCTFIFVQLAVTKVAHMLYAKASPTPEIDCLFFLGTVRGRNVFVNGMFNDPFQVFFCLLGVVCILSEKAPSLALLCFSVGASIKMNALLWAPGVAYHYLTQIGFKRTLLASRAGLLWQLLVGAPFLATHPISYITRSWNLGRQFAWFNSVNWKWVPRSVFYSAWFHYTLLGLHLFFLCLILYLARYDKSGIPLPGGTSPGPVSRLHVAAMLCATHYTGFVFARSLHYSFIIWVLHTLPILYHAGRVPWAVRPFLALAIEIGTNGWYQYVGDALDSCGSWRHALLYVTSMVILLAFLVANIRRLGDGSAVPKPPWSSPVRYV